MKYVFIFTIKVYQLTISPLLHSILGPSICRYEESCSDFAVRIINKEGVVRGTFLAIKRLLSCQPFGLRPHRQS